MINAIDRGGFIVQFPANPIRGNGESRQRFQTIAFDSAGAAYVYSKSATTRRTIPLVYTNVPSAVLQALLVVYAADSGAKTLRDWYDHDGILHSVRFEGAISYTETRSGFYRVSFTFIEDI
jgi:hypothetical protein